MSAYRLGNAPNLYNADGSPAGQMGLDGVEYPSSVSGARIPSGLVAGSAGVATANATAIQAELTAVAALGGGTVSLPNAGTYYVDGSDTGILQIGDDTTLYLGPGVVLQGPDAGVSAVKPIIVNSNWRSNKSAVTSITTSTTGSAPYSTVCTVLLTASPASPFLVGGAILIKGDTTGYFNGVWRIQQITTTTNSNDTITFSRYGLAGAQVPSVATGTVIAYPANIGFGIIGEGAIDGASNANSAGSLGALGRMGVIINKAGGWKFEGVQMRRWTKYGLYYGNTYDAKIAPGLMNTQSDGVHAVGPISRVEIGGYFSEVGDDAVAFTANNTGFTQYDLKDADATKNSDGDMDNVVVAAQFSAFGGSRNILLSSGQGRMLRRFFCRGVTRSGYRSGVGGASVLIDVLGTETGGFEDIYIEGVSGAQPLNQPVISIGTGAGSTLNIKNLNISGVSARGAGATTTGLTHSILGGSNATVNITGLKISGIDVDVDNSTAAANLSMFSFGGGSGIWTVNDIKLNNVSVRAVTVSATRSVRLVSFASTGTWDKVQMANCSVVGSNACLFVSTSSQSGTGQVMIANCDQNGDGTNGGQSLVTLDGARSVDVIVSGARANSALSGAIFVTGGSAKTFNLNLTGIRCSNRLIVNSGTSHTFNVSESACFSTGVTKNSGNITVGTTSTWNMQGACTDIGVDVTTIARVDGAIVFNTNAAAGTLGAAGLVACQGTAANSWRLMGDPTLRV